MKLTNKIGVLLLAIWLILNGLSVLLEFSFRGMPIVMAILAIIAGALLALER